MCLVSLLTCSLRAVVSPVPLVSRVPILQIPSVLRAFVSRALHAFVSYVSCSLRVSVLRVLNVLRPLMPHVPRGLRDFVSHLSSNLGTLVTLLSYLL